jgi:hypothetical protein
VLPAVFPRSVTLTSFLMAAVALSPRVTIGDRVLVDLSGPWAAPLALFRSSGRFLWPLTYVLLTWTVAVVLRRASCRVATIVLAGVVAVQMYDLADFHADRRATGHSREFYEWENPFVSPRWPGIAREFRHLVLSPPPQCATAAIGSEAALWLASRQRLTVNTGTLSRWSEVARARYCDRLGAEMDAGRLEPASLYLMTDAHLRRLPATAEDIACGRIDGLAVCSAAAMAPVWQRYAAPIDRAVSAAVAR